jgi:hypothetical protein
LDTGKGDRESNEYVQVVIVRTLGGLIVAIWVTAFAVSVLDPGHANTVWSASERIITIIITGLFAANRK